MPTGLEIAPKARIITTETNESDGAQWVKVGNQTTGSPFRASQVTVFNDSGVVLSFAYGASDGTSPTGDTFEMPDNSSFTFRGLTSTGQLYARRFDESADEVPFKSVAEGS